MQSILCKLLLFMHLYLYLYLYLKAQISDAHQSACVKGLVPTLGCCWAVAEDSRGRS